MTEYSVGQFPQPPHKDNIWDVFTSHIPHRHTYHTLHKVSHKSNCPRKPITEYLITLVMNNICITNAKHALWANSEQRSQKRKCLHFDEIMITGCTGSCQSDNFQCSQWWKFHQNDDIFVSVMLSYQNWISIIKMEMFVRPSYVYNENFNTGKKALFITSIITPNHTPDYHRTSIISKALPHKLRWYCNKPFSQWQHSCHFESYVTIAYNVCIASQIFSKTGSYQSRQAYIN